MRLRSVLLLASLAIVVPRTADAQPAGKRAEAAKPKEAPKESPKDAARRLFEQGTKELDDGNAAAAVASLTEAEALFHAPTTLFHLARAQTELKQLLEAKASYEKVVAEKLPAKTSDAFKKAQADAKTNLEDLAARIPKVLITVEPKSASNAVITMNGKPLAGITIGEASSINPGTYVFEAKAEGMTAAKLSVSITERTTADVKLLLSPIGKPPIDSSATVSPAEEADWPAGKLASIPVMATGGALMIAGATFFGLSAMRRSEADDRYATCPTCESEVTSIDDEATLFGNLGIGFVAGGGAALLGGVLMYALIDGSGPTEEPALGFIVTPSDVGASWTTRF